MGVWVTVPGLLLLYFLTDVLAVTPWLAGLALLVPKVADIVLHPWVGHRCDAQQARRGDRRRLLLVGCALPVAFAALFAVPGGCTGAPAAAVGGGRVRRRQPALRRLPGALPGHPRRPARSATTSGPG